MPIGNLVAAKAQQAARRRVGDYGPEALNALGTAADALARGINSQSQTLLSQAPGALQQLGSFNFGTDPRTIASKAFRYGASPSVEQGGLVADYYNVPDPYRIHVLLKEMPSSGEGGRWWVVRGVMQEGLRFRTESSWEPLVPQGSGGVADIAAQIGLRSSIRNRWTSRRMWRGTSPLSIEVPLKFHAVRDAYSEVVWPAMRLQQLALPSSTDDPENRVSFLGVPLPVIRPPGPSPFAVDEILSFFRIDTRESSLAAHLRSGDNIQVAIGRQWLFPNVIVKEVSVEFDPKFTPEGYPIEARVSMVFETYQMMTRDELEKSYRQKDAAPTGAVL